MPKGRAIGVFLLLTLIFESYWLAGFWEEMKFQLFEGSWIIKKGWQMKKAQYFLLENNGKEFVF